MNKIVKWAFGLLLIFTLVFIGTMIYHSNQMIVLSPQGMIGQKQSQLLMISIYLMLIVVVPVFIMTIFIIGKYRIGSKSGKYDPTFTDSAKAEIIWWGVPLIIILILSVLTWKGCYELDPFRPIVSEVEPLTVQVVALQWKWLFIYPKYKIATVNFLQFPEKTPIHFEITSDAPMNSFWIPELGGQMYAMSGMKSQLYLIADGEGDYRGLSANISGDGFSGMNFTAKSSSFEAFEEWVQTVKKSKNLLNLDRYRQLVSPSQYDPPAFYQLKVSGLFDWIIMKYMMPMPEHSREMP